MRCSISVVPRKASVWRFTVLLLGAIFCAAACEAVQAQTGLVGVVTVEEDWELVVNTPETYDNSPQVTCVIAPVTLDQGYMALDLNYHTQPDYSPGGVQMHVWSPNTPMVVANSAATNMLQNQNETVTWTTRMRLNPGNWLRFHVLNGKSTTWGDFGGNGELAITVSTSLTDLATYNSTVSLDNSGVPYASNLVTSLTLTAVRCYSASGALLYENNTPQLVHPQE
jgi:hypothetical protein